jgi:hypothetical protein
MRQDKTGLMERGVSAANITAEGGFSTTRGVIYYDIIFISLFQDRILHRSVLIPP